MIPLRMPKLADHYKQPAPEKVKAMRYEDTAECPDGHVFTVWRRVATSGRAVTTTCPECHYIFDAMAGAVPKDCKKSPGRESDIERRLVLRVKALGGEVRKVKWVGRNGAPDRLVMLPALVSSLITDGDCQSPAQTIWIELKAPGGAATFPKNAHERAQHREHERMRKMGQRVEVVDSYERIEEVLS